MNDAAHRVFELGLSGARNFGDEPLELSFLEALLAVGVAQGYYRQSLAQAKERLLRDCLNVTLLRPRGLGADRAAAPEPIFGELRRAIVELTR